MNTHNSSSFDDEDGDWVPLDSKSTHSTSNRHQNVYTPHEKEQHVNKCHDTIDINSLISNSNCSNDSRRNSSSSSSTPHGNDRLFSSRSSSSFSASHRGRQHHSSNKGNSSDKFNETLSNIRNRHERNVEMKENFVNRPLVLFPKLFIYHLVTEFWNTDRTIRIGKVCILTVDEKTPCD